MRALMVRIAALAVVLLAAPAALATAPVTALTCASGDAQATLEWINPADHQGVLVLVHEGSPVTDTPGDGTSYSVGSTVGSSIVRCVTDAAATSCTDTPLADGTVYYYAAYAFDGSFTYSTGADTHAFPRAASDYKWAYTTSAAMLAPAGAGTGRQVVASGNDALFHRMAESDGRRYDWVPPLLGGAAQSRPMEADLAYPNTPPNDVVYVSSQDGYLHRFDLASTGTGPAARDVLGDASAVCDATGYLQAGPVAMLSAFDANTNPNDNVVIQATHCGTTSNAILMYSHDLATRYDMYTGGMHTEGLGVSNATPRILYRSAASNLVYVPLRDDPDKSMVVLGVDSVPSFVDYAVLDKFGPAGKPDAGDIDASPVLFKNGPSNDLLVVGNTAGTVLLYLATDRMGGQGSSLVRRDAVTGTDGAVKGLEASTAIDAGPSLYTHWIVWSTNGQVHGIQTAPNGVFDYGTQWAVTLPSASSPVVLRNVRTAGDVLAYVGGSDGTLYELDVKNHGTVLRSWLLEPGTTVGDATMDFNDGVHVGIVVGTTGGTIHWVPIAP